jgi:hypothetical protein
MLKFNAASAILQSSSGFSRCMGFARVSKIEAQRGLEGQTKFATGPTQSRSITVIVEDETTIQQTRKDTAAHTLAVRVNV